MTSVIDQYQWYSRRRRRRAGKNDQRLDIQGLRMVAVLTVFANHLWGWPHGGFVGVDVFFVISGFLITGNLLRSAKKTGTVSFRRFYWNRIRRIVPAATVVLLLTYLAAVLVFQPFRAQAVGADAVFAFLFASNWWFASEDTDYFNADETVSPLQHYWSLSIEEQFYFVWPALIFLISLLVLRKGWTHSHRTQLAAAVMGVIVIASFGWALYQTATAPAWAYFDTFSRVWELGVGALLAISGGVLTRIPAKVKPVLSWTGLALIAAALLLIGDQLPGFPTPWALLPVAGAALIIAAGVGLEPSYQAFLRNPVSGYIGDISYSLYLVHWPVIVILASQMDAGSAYLAYSVTVLALSFALAIASYHLVETPLRRADSTKLRAFLHDIRWRRYSPEPSSGYAALAALVLVTISLIAYVQRPGAYAMTVPPDVLIAADELDPSDPEPRVGPLATALHGEIVAALKATEWPALDPPMNIAINGPMAPAELINCSGQQPPTGDECTWGSPTAPTRIVLVGDSIATTYGGPLRQLALESNGEIQLHVETMGGCQFSNAAIENADAALVAACPARKQHAVEYINNTKPTMVFVSNTYGEKRFAGTDQKLTRGEWALSMREIVETFRANIDTVVWLAAPPADKNIAECYGERSSVPADCISKASNQWISIAQAERHLADTMNGIWIDSRPWFCTQGLCPAFVGSTPTKRDTPHMTEAYAQKIYPVIVESLQTASVL